MTLTSRILALTACCAVLHGCGTIPAEPGRAAPAPVPVSGALIARAALDVLGTPYRYGGNGPGGFDCSGLVQFAHARAGIELPRTAKNQYAARATDPASLQVGDVLFFRIRGRIAHNGIYLGGGRFIHAPSRGKQVSINRTDQPYFRDRLAGVRRFYD